MPTLSKFPTLLDITKAQDPDGKIAKLVEFLSLSNPILQDLVYKEGNLPTGHQHSVRTGLPSAFWRKAYEGVPVSKSTRATVTDTIGSLHARSEVDAELAALNGNSAEFRMSEGVAFLESLNQEMATTLFYGNTEVAPEKFMGLAPRYNSLSGSESSRNVVSAGGSGSTNTSMWLVVHGESTVHGIYPKGSTAGLSQKDLGEIDAFDAANNRYRALAEIYNWKMGLSVRDWRYVVRIANIQTTDLDAAGLTTGGTQALAAATNLVRKVIEAKSLIPNMNMGKAVLYGNRRVMTAFNFLALEKSSPNVALYEAAANQFGQVGTELRAFGMPLRQVDALIETEAAVA